MRAHLCALASSIISIKTVYRDVFMLSSKKVPLKLSVVQICKFENSYIINFLRHNKNMNFSYFLRHFLHFVRPLIIVAK